MSLRRLVIWNSVVWAAAMLGSAVLLQGQEDSIGVLIVLICGAAGSDTLLAWAFPKA